MTPQEIFDTVYRHLMAQGQPASDGVACLYCAPDGLRCAVGCLIPDDVYDADMESRTICQLYTLWPVLDWMRPHESLLKDLQSVHDSVRVYDWECTLRQVAAGHGLRVPE